MTTSDLIRDSTGLFENSNRPYTLAGTYVLTHVRTGTVVRLRYWPNLFLQVDVCPLSSFVFA